MSVKRSSSELTALPGGTAGLALANRLTERGNQTVLVLEAGSNPDVIAASKSPLSALVLGSFVVRRKVPPSNLQQAHKLIGVSLRLLKLL